MAFWDTVLSRENAKLYGRRLIPHLVDENARTQPNRACFSLPISYTNLHHGFQDISWRQFANAVNRLAHFLQNEFVGSSPKTFMYMGFPDIRAFIVLVASMKTGHKVLFSSHWNSLAGHANLVRQTQCTILLHTAGFPVSGILERCRLAPIQVPELAALLNDAPCEPFPFNKTFEQVKHDICCFLHTSGSTGLPAPVKYTHWSFSTTDQHHLVAPLDGRPTVWGELFDARRRSYMALPLSASSAIGSGITDVMFNNTTIVLGPPEQPTAEIMEDMIRYADIDSASCVPATLDELSRRPAALAAMRRLRHISTVGGSLSQTAGDILSQYVTIIPLMASTETMVMVQHVTDQEDWAYACINPVVNGIEMRPVADLFELVYVRKPGCADFQGVFKAFPDRQEHPMRDLYSKHPTKPHHWKHEGRKDDIIIFRNGAKFNPMLHERMIAQHAKVDACLVVGTGHNKPAAIIQLHPKYYTEDISVQKALIKDIWPQVRKANDVADTCGQLEQRYVMFAKQDKPMQMGLKGTVRRSDTTQLYAQEIANLYAVIAAGGLSALFQTEAVIS